MKILTAIFWTIILRWNQREADWYRNYYALLPDVIREHERRAIRARLRLQSAEDKLSMARMARRIRRM